MNTVFLLMAEFESPYIPLADICEKYFGMKITEARRKASLQQLPFAVFRGGSQRSGWLVNINDLAMYLDTQREEARKVWQQMNR